MNESGYTQKLIKAIHKARAGLCFKHTDAFRSNVPDMSVTNRHGTLWIEVKVVAWPVRFDYKNFREGQLVAMCQLEKENPKGIVYAVFVYGKPGLFYSRPSWLHDAIATRSDQGQSTLVTMDYFVSLVKEGELHATSH